MTNSSEFIEGTKKTTEQRFFRKCDLCSIPDALMRYPVRLWTVLLENEETSVLKHRRLRNERKLWTPMFLINVPRLPTQSWLFFLPQEWIEMLGFLGGSQIDPESNLRPWAKVVYHDYCETWVRLLMASGEQKDKKEHLRSLAISQNNAARPRPSNNWEKWND